MSRGVTILGGILALSLALNLFWAATLIGGQFRHPDPLRELTARMTAIWQDLPQVDQPIVKEIAEQHHDDIVAKWHAMRSSAVRANQALHATPFENDVVQEALTKWNQRSIEFRTAVQELEIEAAAKISPEGREHLRWRGP